MNSDQILLLIYTFLCLFSSLLAFSLCKLTSVGIVTRPKVPGLLLTNSRIASIYQMILYSSPFFTHYYRSKQTTGGFSATRKPHSSMATVYGHRGCRKHPALMVKPLTTTDSGILQVGAWKSMGEEAAMPKMLLDRGASKWIPRAARGLTPHT